MEGYTGDAFSRCYLQPRKITLSLKLPTADLNFFHLSISYQPLSYQNVMNTEILVIHLHAAPFLNVVTLTGLHLALVNLPIPVLLPTADQSVQLTLSVQAIKHAYERNVEIHALVHAVETQIAMS